MKCLKIRERFGISSVNCAQQILCLMFELIQIGADWKSSIWHDEPP